MPNYLTKEDIKRWRSSLDRITLEQYAQKLGKVIQKEKETFDMVDMVMEHCPINNENIVESRYNGEKITNVAANLYKGEKITKTLSLMDIKQNKSADEENTNIKKENKSNKKEIKEKNEPNNKPIEKKEVSKKACQINNIVGINLKKDLTHRETLVLEHFIKNKNLIVYAKDLAEILDLPRDYVYKYIKNLRAKIENPELLENASKGGYILRIK